MHTTPVRQYGASIVLWLLLTLPMVGMAVVALDLNSIYVTQAELQTAADAGAIEGARLLYQDDGSGSSTLNTAVGSCDTSCGACGGDPACETAILNHASSYNPNNPKPPVEVVSVRRGHWTFLSSFQDAAGIERGGVFTPYDGLPSDLTTASGEFREVFSSDPEPTAPYPTCPPSDPNAFLNTRDLNSDPCWVNAVEVVVRQQNTGILVGLLQRGGWEPIARAVGYVDFGGVINPDELDAPIALCEHLMRDEATNEFDCGIARLSTSSNQDEGAAKWTDMSVSEVGQNCGAAGTNTVQTKISEMSCAGGNGLTHNELRPGVDQLSVTGTGVATPNINSIQSCFRSNDATPIPALLAKKDGPREAGTPDSSEPFPDEPLGLKVPVIDCDDAASESCAPIFGAVSVQMIWANGNNERDNRIPSKMTGVEGYSDWDVATGTQTDRYNGQIPAPTDPPPAADAVTHGAGPFVGEDYPYHARVWDSFVKHFGIRYVATDSLGNKTLETAWYDIENPQIKTGFRTSTFYFSPACSPATIGRVGGAIPFQLAVTPVLVN